MCELFYYPYNEKLYKYPLEKIAADDGGLRLGRNCAGGDPFGVDVLLRISSVLVYPAGRVSGPNP
jgi:hypothetical protein